MFGIYLLPSSNKIQVFFKILTSIKTYGSKK